MSAAYSISGKKKKKKTEQPFLWKNIFESNQYRYYFTFCFLCTHLKWRQFTVYFFSNKQYQCKLQWLALNLIVIHYNACHLFCSYQYNDAHGGYSLRDIYFWQLQQIKTHIRPYVTSVSARQSSTFFKPIQHLLIFSSPLWIMLSILLTDNNATRLNLCSSNRTARETICIFLCRLSALRCGAGGRGSVGIWYGRL